MGQVIFKGTPDTYADTPMGKNIVNKVPCKMQQSLPLGLDNPVSFTSFSTTLVCHSSSTAAEHPFSSLWIFMDGLIRV